MIAAPSARAEAEHWLARDVDSAWSLATTSSRVDQGDHSPKMITLLAAPPRWPKNRNILMNRQRRPLHLVGEQGDHRTRKTRRENDHLAPSPANPKRRKPAARGNAPGSTPMRLLRCAPRAKAFVAVRRRALYSVAIR
jgi:hypothetical protein